MEQLLAHLVGDYVLQSDWMALTKPQKTVAAAVHAALYTLPFLLLTSSPEVLTIIAGTHFVIDRFRLARYVCWAKNFLAPRHSYGPCTDCGAQDHISHDKVTATWWHPWSACSATGYHESRPVWLAVWLLIITDNTLHLLCNYAALRWAR